MCIIVDANVAHAMFSADSGTETGRIVRDWVMRGSNRLVFGGRNATELFQAASAKRWILQAWRSGRARQISNPDIEREVALLRGVPNVTSNDLHILALARASGARLLFSDDNALIHDFKNASIIAAPRGKVFRKPAHRRTLLSGDTCCPT